MLKRLNTYSLLITIVIIAATILITGNVWAVRGGEGGRGDGPIIYVTSQDLFFDSIVTANLPAHGPFQQLFPPPTNPDYPDLLYLSTEFGPGDHDYVGGRWRIDFNDNGEMDEGDMFFSCPLLGPGREAP